MQIGNIRTRLSCPPVFFYALGVRQCPVSNKKNYCFITGLRASKQPFFVALVNECSRVRMTWSSIRQKKTGTTQEAIWTVLQCNAEFKNELRRTSLGLPGLCSTSLQSVKFLRTCMMHVYWTNKNKNKLGLYCGFTHNPPAMVSVFFATENN